MHTPSRNVTIHADPAHPRLRERALALGRELGLAVGDGGDMLLAVSDMGLGLRMVRGDEELTGGRDVRVELEHIRAEGGLKAQPLARALGMGKGRPAPLVLDCTAGLGKDSWLAALFGCRVLSVEQDPVVFALLRDGLERVTRVSPGVGQRVAAFLGDGLTLLRQTAESGLTNALTACAAQHLPPGWDPELPAVPDVVYLDPMFPGADKRKTKEKKAMRMVRQLAGGGEGADRLLQAALHSGAGRVVLKLPLKAASPGSLPPSTSYRGKGLRYDVYIPAPRQ